MQVTYLGLDDAQGILRALLATQGHDWVKLRQRAHKKNLTPQRSALLPTPFVCAQGLHLFQLQANSKTGKNCKCSSGEMLPCIQAFCQQQHCCLLHNPLSTPCDRSKSLLDWLPSEPERGLAGALR